MYRDKFIYLIEDSEDDNILIRAALKRHGVGRIEDTDEANSAVDKVLGLDKLPDLIMVDKHLVGIDGADVAKTLNNHSETIDIPVCLITGSDRVDVPDADLYKGDKLFNLRLEQYLEAAFED